MADVAALKPASKPARPPSVLKAAGLNAAEWTPHELRHSFASLLSNKGMTIEQISRLVGHSGTSVTEEVYRHQIRPVIQDGAIIMDQIFPVVAEP